MSAITNDNSGPINASLAVIDYWTLRHRAPQFVVANGLVVIVTVSLLHKFDCNDVSTAVRVYMYNCY